MMLLPYLITLIASSGCSLAFSTSDSSSRNQQPPPQNHQPGKQARPEAKLLVVVIGGFRWDYIRRFTARGTAFPGFTQFMQNGVQTEYLESVFPSESFPAWQTINTGLYPGDHNIIANQFADGDPDLDANTGKFFDKGDEQSTGLHKWWQQNEPIWATASKAGLNFSTFLWSRCDVEWYDVKTEKPSFCENMYRKDDSKTLFLNIEMSLIHFQTGVDAAMIYEDSLLKASAQFGPLSVEVENKLKELDAMIQDCLERMAQTRMDELVNFIILSDHGMTYGANPSIQQHNIPNFPYEKHTVRYVSMEAALRPVGRHVRMVIGDGAYAMVYPKSLKMTGKIVEALRMTLKGVEIYERDQIPEHLHWKQSKYCPPILVLASPGTVIQKATGQHQRPQLTSMEYYDEYYGGPLPGKPGISGYDPQEMDMRGIFMARGPGFKPSNSPQPAIHLVDIYRMLCFLLDIEPQANDSVWDRIRRLLRNSSVSVTSSVLLTLASLFVTSAIQMGSRHH